MKKMNRFLCALLVLCMIVSLLPVSAFAVVNGEDRDPETKGESAAELKDLVTQRQEGIVSADGSESTALEIQNPGVDLKLDQNLDLGGLSPYEAQEMVRVIVELEEKSLLEQGFTQMQIASANANALNAANELVQGQTAMVQKITQVVNASGLMNSKEKTVAVKYNYTVAMNGVAMSVPYGALEAIRALDGVKNAYVVTEYRLPEENMVQNTAAEPNMYASNESFGSVQTWENLGYTGKGMTIAVIDTGLDLDHPSFAAAPEGAKLTLADIESALTDLNAYKLYGQTSAVKLTADKLYRSEKVPYAFNYVDCGLDATHDYDQQGDHGTHVAGTAAANRLDSTTVVGVAPDAQVVVMKVFGQQGGAYTDDILAAIEDCVRLDVDVVNMSLGSPAGFSEDSQLVNEVFGRILKTDMLLAVAAGNSGSAAAGNALGTNLNLTGDPDNGIVTSPATYLASTMVASVENASMMMPYFTVGENKLAYVDVTYKFASLAGEHSYVMIPGYGEAADYEGLDVKGKIAVVSRGGGDTVTFVVKQQNAYNAGAVALIVYNNVEGDLVSMYDQGLLPNVFVSKADGAILKAAADEKGEGKLTIMQAGEETAVPSSVAGYMSDFSSWGVTPDLLLAPDVTAPGGNIYSAINDGKYGTMSGTSMASPHIAGMSALVLQYLHEEHPELTGEQLHVAAEALVMSTAVPLEDPDGLLYSPRKQGAGLANVYDAVISPVYLTSLQANGELTPKASLGDDPTKTGVYTFSFDMHNFSDKSHSYLLSGSALTDQFVQIDGLEYMGETARELEATVAFETAEGVMALEYDANLDGVTDMADVQFLLDVVNGLETLEESRISQFDLHADDVLNTVDVQLLYELLLTGFEAQEVLTIAAGETVTVYVTVTLSAADKAYMNEHYANGIYVDGFVRAYAQSEGAVDLSLPFVGFYGEWSDAPVIDSGWYYEDEPVVNRYLNVIYTTLGAGNSGAAGLGMNPYLAEDDYTPEHNVLSPNGDYYYDYVNEIYISQLRSAELLDFTWTNEAGEELFYEWYPYARKSFYWAAYGMCLPSIYTDVCQPFTLTDENGNLMVEELEKLTLTIRAYLDDGDLDALEVDAEGNPLPNTAWADDVVEIPVVIDTTAPKLNLSSITYTTENGRTFVSFEVEDNYDIAAVVTMTAGGDAYEYIPVTGKVEGVDGEKATLKIDITDYDTTFQLVVCDYGCNETYYELTNTGSTGLSSDRFFAFRRYSTPVFGNTVYMTDQLNGWYSFENADEMMMHTSQPVSGEANIYAAEYIDGFIIGAQDGGTSNGGANTLFAMKAGSWERTQLGSSRAMRKTVYQWPGEDGTYFPLTLIALDMAYDYTTDTLYMLANALENNYFPEGVENLLLQVDYLTGDVTLLGIIEAAQGEEFLALTLACDNDGVLYTVNYEDGKLYTIDTESVESAYGDDVAEIKNPMNRYTAACVSTGDTDYYPAAYTQAMTVDHETNKLYWAGYQGRTGIAYFFEVDKQSGKLLSAVQTADNAEMVGLFKPYDSGKDIVPAAELQGITLKSTDLYLNVGQTATITATPDPFNAELGVFTYTSYDESVASVNAYGMVEAKGVGSTMIEIMCETADGNVAYATCFVNVSNVDGTLFGYSDGYWLLMNAGKPFEANQIVDAMELEGDVKAAAYLQGFLYAAAVTVDYDEDWNEVYTTNLYKLDPSTLQGELIGSYEGNTTALAFNYADGFLYGMTQSLDMEWWSYSYDLVRVNIGTAEITNAASLNEIFNNLDLWETCSGALAIDYEGNFYVTGDNEYYEYEMVRFNLDENDQLTDVTTFPGLLNFSYDGEAMVWSERNGGILRATMNEMTYTYNLTWIDVSDMENVVEIDLGQIRGGSYPGVFALAIPLSQEPSLPGVTPTAITLEERYSVHEGETVKVVPTLEPWNANAQVVFEIADETIATVDAKGVITGVSVGETTVTVTVPGTELTATAAVIVEDNPGYLYGYFQADIAQSIPLEMWAKIPIADSADSSYLTDLYDFTIYAGAYYDGYVYAYGMSQIDYLYYVLRIVPSNFSYEIIAQGDMMIREMAFDYTTGTMYAVGYNEMISGGLFQMDLDTGDLTLIGDNDMGATLVALAADDAGNLYAADDYGEVFLVDKENVWLTSTGIYGGSSQYLQSMVYDFNNDAIYWAKGGSLYQVDVENGELIGLGMADVDSGEMATSGCVVSALFSVPEEAPAVPETVEPSGVALAEKNTVAVGQTLTLDAVVLPVSVSTVDQTLTWSSDDESIATVTGGVVTGVSAGEVFITVTDSKGNSDSILITVTAEQRMFYGYDEISRSWVSFGFDGKIVDTWADAEELSPIVAAQYIGDTLYAYDAEGYFYTVDTETFARTQLGSGINGLTVDLDTWDSSGVGINEDVPYQVIDMTYNTTTNRWGQTYTVAYAAIMAYSISEWQDSFSYKIVEIDLTTGEILEVIVEDSLVDYEMSLRPSNLIYRNGYLYTVNGYIAGMITRIDPFFGDVNGTAIFAEYWGDFNGGRSWIVDELTGEVYAIRDKRTDYIGMADYDPSLAQSELCTIDIGVARCDVLCEIGSGLRITGLFIK